MSRILLCAVVAAGTSAPLWAQEQRWVRQLGTPEFDGATALCPDSYGGVFVAGATSESLVGFHIGQGDAWVARYGAQGNRIWGRQFGGIFYEEVRAVTPDGLGGVFLTGFTRGTMAGTHAGSDDVWMARYDRTGGQLWVFQFGTTASDSGEALSADGAGGMFAAGVTGGNLGGTNAGNWDVWVARYDSAGGRIWIRQFGSSQSDEVNAMSSDGQGGVFVTGNVWGFNSDIWLARYDGSGNQLWYRQFGTGGVADYGEAVCSDGAGGALVAGTTYSNLGGPTAGVADVWIARYDAEGNRTWIRQFGSVQSDRAQSLCSDGAGGAFVVGYTVGTLAETRVGSTDAWLARYDSAGNRVWIRQFGSTGSDEAHAVSPDDAGGVFAAGYTYGAFGGLNAGGGDVWLARFGPPCAADFNHDGQLDFFDYLDFALAFDAEDDDADYNDDGQIDFFDYLDFAIAFDAGCE